MGNFNRLKSRPFLSQLGSCLFRQAPVFIRRHTSENASKSADCSTQAVRIRLLKKPPTGEQMGEKMGERSRQAAFDSRIAWVGERSAGTCPYDRRPCRRPRCLSCRRPGVVLAAGLALAFDPHVLLLSWSAERQETVAATSLRTCTAAIDAIAAGRWLADDPPAAVRCERGSAFPPGWDCIEGFNCGMRR